MKAPPAPFGEPIVVAGHRDDALPREEPAEAGLVSRQLDLPARVRDVAGDDHRRDASALDGLGDTPSGVVGGAIPADVKVRHVRDEHVPSRRPGLPCLTDRILACKG